MQPGDQIPDFQLLDHNSEWWNTKTHLPSSPFVIFFYPRDNTPGCTKEACRFRDLSEELEALDAPVIGISSDSVKRHASFRQEYDLPFTLLSDPKGKVRKLFGVKGMLFGFMPERVTFVFDAKGVLKARLEKLAFEDHANEALRILEELSGK